MAMVNLDIRDDDSMTMPSEYSNAPCLYLTAAQCAALGISEPPRAGTKLMLRAQCEVVSTTESNDGDEDDPDIRVTLEIEAAELSTTPAEGATEKLYGKS